MSAPCFICLGEGEVTSSTGCGCSSSQICRPCASWFTVEKTYERIERALYHNERDENVVACSSVNPLWAKGCCSICKRPYTGNFKTFLQQETLKLLFWTDKFPNGRNYVYPGYILLLLLDTYQAEYLGALKLVERPEDLKVAFEAVFDETLQKIKDRLVVDEMTIDMAETMIKVCTLEKAWLLRTMESGAVMSSLPKDVLERMMLATRLRYLIARELIKMAPPSHATNRANVQNVQFAVEYQLTYHLWKPTEATEKECVTAITDAVEIMLQYPYRESSPQDRRHLIERLRMMTVQLGVFLDADARYTDLQRILQRVLLWAHGHGLSSDENVVPLIKGYCNLMSARMRDQEAAVAFLQGHGIPVPHMPPAPTRRRSNRIAAAAR